MRALAAIAFALTLLAACDSEPYDVGVDQPIIVPGAELKQGKLPANDDGATVTALELNFGVLRAGATNVSLKGRTTDDAYGVAIRFEDLGSGYWVRPPGAPDPTLPGELTFDFTFQAASDIPAGKHALIAVAFDKRGKAGPTYTVPICVVSDIPDNQNACDSSRKPPPAIISLSWDADADLDLIIEGPGGVRYDRSHRTERDGDEDLWGLELDGSTGCLVDGRRRENFVFHTLPEEGATFLAYASFFDACQHPAVDFALTVYRSEKVSSGRYRLVKEPSVRGQFVRAQANGGAGRPLYLQAITF